MKSLLEWNDAIAQHFFRPENAGRTVYLDATEELIEALGAADGATCGDFVAAMRSGPPWAKPAGLCQTALQTLHGWRGRGLPLPPYVGFLALFVLAGSREGDFASHAYYPRLRELLGETPHAGQFPSFDRMFELWDDLERWLNREQAGSLGLLRTDIAGSKMHVGLPWAQAILTAREREHLQDVFAEANLDPAAPPSDAELARILRARPQGFRARTLAALQPNQLESDYGSVLLDRILEELESWEDTAVATAVEQQHARSGAVVLCLTLDRTAGTANFQVRLRLRGPFPEVAVAMLDGTEFTFRELANGYTSVLVDASRKPLDGARHEWRRPVSLFTRAGDVLARSGGAEIRIFTDGSASGVTGYIEARSFDPTRPFVIAATGSASAHVRAWAAATWSDFREERVTGAPPTWDVFTGTRAASDDLIRAHVPQLAFAKRLRRIRLEGGLKIPATQFYFRFAPPSVRVDGASDATVVRFNDTDPVPRDASGAFRIPEVLLTENAIRVACDDNGVQLQRTVYLRDDVGEAGAAVDVAAYTAFGARDEAGAAAAYACGVPPSAERFASSPLIALEPEEHAVLIGASPGQLAPYAPGTEVSWSPAWAVIYHRRRAHAQFVGQPPHPPAPAAGANTDRRALREWQDILWHQRRRIAEPKFEPARRLWIEYQQRARHG